MLLREAKEILNKHGYILEDYEYSINYKGPRGSAIVDINGKQFSKKDFKNSDWIKLSNDIATFNSYYPAFKKILDMDPAELADNMDDFWIIRCKIKDPQLRIGWYLKAANLDADVGEPIDELYKKKRNEVIKYNKKLIADKTNAILADKSDHVLCFPGFERAITLNVEWGNGTFYQWSGLCAFISLSEIKGLTQNRYPDRRGEYDLTPENLNKIEKWMNDNKDYIEKEMEKGRNYFDSVAADQARYYSDHPNGNWSGD